MEVEVKGGESPDLAVVACLHGDEKCGKAAIEEFKESGLELERPVKFIKANERAMEEDQRFIDTDLNRCFPGDPDSRSHEERLAHRLMKELDGMNVLVIHSMEDFDEAFGLVNGRDSDLMRSTGVEKIVDVAPLGEDSVEKYLDAVSVEAGEKGSDRASRNAYRILLNFLAFFDAVDEQPEKVEPEVFEMYESVKGSYNFLAENFSEVEEGELFAESSEEKLRASEGFYPILMSSDQYDDILGFKGRKVSGEGIKDPEVNS